jgi:uncharacterized protein (TIGR02996 family)
MSFDPRHPEFQAFVRQMRAAPRDDTTRLVLCDWLDEYGGADLALLFRGMIEVARVDPANRLTLQGWLGGRANPFRPGGPSYLKSEYALKRTWAIWPPVKDLAPLSLLWAWHRGTLDEVCVDWTTWKCHWHRIIAFGPVGEVTLINRPRVEMTAGLSLYEFRSCWDRCGRGAMARWPAS